MVATKLQNFGGMLPAVDERLLPDNAAAYSENAWVYSGAVTGINVPTPVYTCTSDAISKVFRIPKGYSDNVGDSYWLEFVNPDTDVVRAPVVGDTFKRYYWASSSSAPRYNTTDRIIAKQSSFLLGIPAPAAPNSVTVTGGSTAIVVSRAYVCTYVSAYGEEGPPSLPVTQTGNQNGNWTITLPAVGTNDRSERNLAKRRIYRTITASNGQATYFLVAELNIPVSTTATQVYTDSKSDTGITGAGQLQSTLWTPPPALNGIIAMPNGMLAGWMENELWFAEPYRPHAWPSTYSVAVEYPIVGLGVIGQTLIVCTQGFPTAATGVNPASISLSKLSAYEPCLSRGSIVSAPEGVYYASQNGLVLVAAGQIQNITRNIITKEKWQELAPVGTLQAARLGTAYYAYGARRLGGFNPEKFNMEKFSGDDYSGARRGVLVDPQNERVAFNPLADVDPTANVFNDPWSGEVLLIRSALVDGVKKSVVYWINTADTTPTYELFKWRSKEFQLQNRRNLGVMRVWFQTTATSPELNPTPMTGLDQTVGDDRWGVVRVYADGVHVATRELRESGKMFRLPSGFKAEYWQFEIEARVRITSVQIGASPEDLKNV